VSVSVLGIAPDAQYGVNQSDGHPDHADGTIVGGRQSGGSAPVSTTPCGSPGVAAGGPTVAGGTLAGSFSFGIMSGGRIERRESQPTIPIG